MILLAMTALLLLTHIGTNLIINIVNIFLKMYLLVEIE